MTTDTSFGIPPEVAKCDPRYVEGWVAAHAMRVRGGDLDDLRDRPSPDAWSEEKRNGFNDRLAEEHHALASGNSTP